MLDEYFQGTLPQLIERAKLLKAKIPRTLSRDYGALIKTCEMELADVIERFRGLQAMPRGASLALHHAQLRKFKRAVADLDHIETTAIPVLNRAHPDDDHANRLLFKVCQEIKYPLTPPTVTVLSTGYFYIDTQLQLMFIPLAEGNFLLHLPDLYHELCHPLLTHQDHPVLDRLKARYLECVAYVHDHFAAQRAKEDLRRGPRGFKNQIDMWELLWSKYWLTEFFCDLYALVTLGPAFAWSHLHLYLKTGGDAYALPDGIRNITHPADDARMRALLAGLQLCGFDADVAEIRQRWQETLRLTTDVAAPDYFYCYPDELIEFVACKAKDGTLEMDCRVAGKQTRDPVHLLLNTAWQKFWTNPGSYHTWEAAAVRELFEFCEGKITSLPSVA